MRFDHIGEFLEDNPKIAVGGIGAVLLVGSFGLTAALASYDNGGQGALVRVKVPSSLATADSFPNPTATVTQTQKVRRKDGSIATRTVRQYIAQAVDGTERIIRETVREPIPGVRITSTQTIRGPNVTSTATALIAQMTTETATATTVTRETIVGPGDTETIIVSGPTQTETITVTGPGSTSTSTETTTVTAPGPTSTETVTVPGPEVTVTEPAPTVTVTEPGPTVTVTEPPLP